MSELEPTRTYSNPTATDILRRMLDERGVEWGASDTYRLLVTSWNDVSGHSWAFMEHRDGSFSKLTAYHITPAQAIAATLGSCNVGRYVGLRQGEYWERTENSNYYCGGCGWKVTDHDSYCPECGGALHEYALGTETCHEVMINRHWRGCGECGYVWENMYGEGFQIGPNYCPMCGKRVKKVAE